MSNSRNTLIGSLLIASFVLAPSISYARENEPNDDSSIRLQAQAQININSTKSTTSSTTLKQRLEDRREDRIEKLQGEVDDRLSKLREDIEKRIQNHAEWMIKRFNAAVERLEKLTARIETRIAKLKSEGKNTAEAEKFVVEAKIQIGEAVAGIAKIEVACETALSADSLKGSFEEVRSLADSIRDDLKAAHRALMSTLPIIKGLSTSLNVNASTSVQTVQ